MYKVSLDIEYIFVTTLISLELTGYLLTCLTILYLQLGTLLMILRLLIRVDFARTCPYFPICNLNLVYIENTKGRKRKKVEESECEEEKVVARGITKRVRKEARTNKETTKSKEKEEIRTRHYVKGKEKKPMEPVIKVFMKNWNETLHFQKEVQITISN